MKSMRILLAVLTVVALAGTSAWAGCPPKYKWINMQVTELVPVKVWKTVDKEVQVQQFKTVEKQVPVTVYKTVWEEKQFEGKRAIMVDEEYTVNEVRQKIVEEEKTRTIVKMVPRIVEQQVTVCTYKKECDPCTGKTVKVPVTETKTIQCQVMDKVEEQQTYTVKRCVEEVVPVTKTRQVQKWEPQTLTVKVAVCKPFEEMRTVKVCEPEMVTKTVQEKVCEVQYKEVTKCVRQKVPVCPDGQIISVTATPAEVPAAAAAPAAPAAEPAPAPAPAAPAAK